MDDLIERLRAVKWEVTDDGDRMPDDPTQKCVFVDMRPDEFEALLRETAAALEAAREDAERWRFCVERDVMPVIANDGKTWCMFVAITSNRRSLFTGKTPAEAVDAAIDRERAKENGND